MADRTRAQWAKSTRSGTGECVQVRRVDDVIEVRDSKLGDDSPVLRFTPAEWVAFAGGMADGEFAYLLDESELATA